MAWIRACGGGSPAVPDGRTVTPINDVTVWQQCAGIANPTYTTLADILADVGVLSVLMASDNAVDYLVRSKSWSTNKELVPTMTSNTTPSGYVASATSSLSSSYDAYKAFNGSYSTGTTDRWLSTQDTEGGRLTIKFPSAVCIKKSSIVEYCADQTQTHNETTIYVEGSNDGTTWSDTLGSLVLTDANKKNIQNITLNNNASYLYYSVRFETYNITSVGTKYCGLAEVQFYPQTYEGVGLCDNATAMQYIGANNYASNTLLADSDWCTAICHSSYFESVLNVKVPTMTSNTTPSGVASATTYSSPYMAYMAFDNIVDNSNIWASGSRSITNQRLQYKFNRPVKIYMAIESYTNAQPTTHPKNIKYQCSSDNATWTDKASETWSQPTGYGEHKTIFPTTTSAEYWALYILNNWGNEYVIWVHDLQFYGREDI